MADENKKEKWYPGKYLGKAVRRSSTTPSSNRSSYDGRGSDNKINGHDDDHIDLREHSFIEIPISDIPRDDNVKNITNNNNRHDAQTTNRVRVKLLEIRYGRFTQSKFSIRVGGIKVKGIQENQLPFEKVFDIQDIKDDIRIEVNGLQGVGTLPNQGVVYVPLVSLLSFTGSILPASSQWREIYPLYDSSKRTDDLCTRKFVGALADLPGSGMTKPKYSLGFLHIEAEILLPTKSALGLYLLPSQPEKNSGATITGEEVTKDETIELTDSRLAVQQAVFLRDLERLRAALFQVFGSICFSVRTHHLPLTIFFLVLGNGKRSYGSIVTVWNEPGLSAPAASSPLLGSSSNADVAPLSESSAPNPSVLALLRANAFLASQLSSIVHEVEVFHNILTFADPRVSIIAYGVLLGVALFATFWLLIFPVSSLIFCAGSLLILALTLTSFLQDQAAVLPEKSVYLGAANAINKGFAFWKALRSRVPDELEMVHRYIASTAVTKDTNMNMLDAASEYVSAPPSK
eukprot:scaffold3491_cov160-Ochromonas_danica.AAC.4